MNVFYGKMNEKSQLDNMENIAGIQSYYSTMEVGDYVFIRHSGDKCNGIKSPLKRLWKLEQYFAKDGRVHAKFNKVFEFKEIELNKFISLDIFKLDINLLNKIKKQIKGKGFFKLDIVDIDLFENIVKSVDTFNKYIHDENHYRKITVKNDINEFSSNSKNIEICLDRTTDIYDLNKTQGFVSDDLKNRFDGEQPMLCKEVIGNNDRSSKIRWINLIENNQLDKLSLTDFYDLFYGKPNNNINNDNEEIDEKEIEREDNITQRNLEKVKNYTKILMNSSNVIFHGAPGTGKTYLAKEIASYIVSDKKTYDYTELNNEQQKQIGFVQFHPSYDYTDFVEGLRPISSNDGNVGFALKPGTFKDFIDKAIENSKGINTSDSIIDEYLSKAYEDEHEFEMKKKDKFIIEDINDNYIVVNTRNNNSDEDKPLKPLKSLKISIIKKLLYSSKQFENVLDIPEFLNLNKHNCLWSYYFPIINEFRKEYKEPLTVKSQSNKKNYVFIIDEINRGEISKIFGELFFTIDPEYRGEGGKVLTQYANLHDDPNEKFYIPENVYIIGTMNDIDRSVDSFDFAMRRRFRFINIKADNCDEILDEIVDKESIDEIKMKMNSLNKEICKTEGLGENYQIGASYYLKLNEIDFNELWNDYLKPLLQDYIKGFSNDEELLENFKNAYYGKTDDRVINDSEDN